MASAYPPSLDWHGLRLNARQVLVAVLGTWNGRYVGGCRRVIGRHVTLPSHGKIHMNLEYFGTAIAIFPEVRRNAAHISGTKTAAPSSSPRLSFAMASFA